MGVWTGNDRLTFQEAKTNNDKYDAAAAAATAGHDTDAVAATAFFTRKLRLSRRLISPITVILLYYIRSFFTKM